MCRIGQLMSEEWNIPGRAHDRREDIGQCQEVSDAGAERDGENGLAGDQSCRQESDYAGLWWPG